MENKFIEAIEKNEVEKFLLGGDEYFYHGNEWSGGYEKHDTGVSFGDINNGIVELFMSEETVYQILDKAMINILTSSGNADNISANNVFEMSMIVWRYFTHIKNGTFKTNWKFSDKLLLLLRERYLFHLFHNKNIEKQLHELMTVNNKLLKERFYFEIC